jgi:probable HAF family extracellular repeat protein
VIDIMDALKRSLAQANAGQAGASGAETIGAFGINNSGQIIGQYHTNVGGVHGFLDTDGNITTIDVPGAIHTFALGINTSGQIVGRLPLV